MTRALKVVVTGVSGRMGSTLVRLIQADAGLSLVGATERPQSPAHGLDAGKVAQGEPCGILVSDAFLQVLTSTQPDVVIDFTSADASVAHAAHCADVGVPLVIGSTGLAGHHRDALAQSAKRAAILSAPNMSVGVNVLFEVAALLAKRLGEGFDVEVLESHHRLKKDAPSGTALKLADVLREALGRDESDVRTTRDGDIGPRPKSEIGVQTLRGGDVVGEHTVYFYGDGERIELTHRATNRDQFARGALRAAAWLSGKPHGLYDMAHVLSGA